VILLTKIYGRWGAFGDSRLRKLNARFSRPPPPCTLTVNDDGAFDVNLDLKQGIAFSAVVSTDYVCFALKSVSPGTATYSANIYDSVWNVVQELGTIDLSFLTASYAWYQFPVIPLTFTVQTDQFLGMQKKTGDENCAKIRWNSATGPYPGETCYYNGSNMSPFAIDSKQCRR